MPPCDHGPVTWPGPQFPYLLGVDPRSVTCRAGISETMRYTLGSCYRLVSTQGLLVLTTVLRRKTQDASPSWVINNCDLKIKKPFSGR